MSTINCEACDKLRQIAPELATVGLTDAMCTSLSNDTGLNNKISPLHNDKTDMDYLVDCAVGRMAQEIKTYDVCDWKEYMKKFVPNLHDVLKAINCVDAGQWTKINEMDVDELWEFVMGLCERMDQALIPQGRAYGTFDYYDSEHTTSATPLGTIAEKSGTRLVTPTAKSGVPEKFWSVTGPGVLYYKKKLKSCSDGKSCMLYEWIEPWFYQCWLDASVTSGDILWYCDKASFMAATGASEALWTTFTKVTASTPDGGGARRWSTINLGNHKYAWVWIEIDPDRMGTNYITLRFDGTSYPDADPGNVWIASNQGRDYTVIRSEC